MLGWPRDVHVDVILNPDGETLPNESARPEGYNLPFKLESDELQVGPDNLLTFTNNRHPGFYVHYHLKDPHDTGYRFPDDERDAMWSREDDPCPRQKSHWPQFKGKEVKPGNKVLVVRNFNAKKASFGYTLRVTLNPHVHAPKFAHLDPPGDNTNGTSGYYSTSGTLLLAGAVATVTFVAVASFDLVDSNVALGATLLAALTVGFAVAALWERLRR